MRLPAFLRVRADRRNRFRPTAAGWVFLTLLAGVTLAALNTGNNLLYLLLSLLLTLLLANNLLGEWNLRNLRLRRQLPVEAFAHRSAAGFLELRNPRRILPAFSLRLRDAPGDPHPGFESGTVRCTVVPCGGGLRAPVQWRFLRRGWCHLHKIRISSTFPFGLLERWRWIRLGDALLVYPELRAGHRTADTHITGASFHDDRQRGGAGDFLGLREYRPGDPLRHVHWRTSARLGEPMVVERGHEVDDEVMVTLEATTDPSAWEHRIRRAAGQVEHHFHLGRAVGLTTPDTTLQPRRAEAHRRRMLTVLALLPGRESAVSPEEDP